MRCCLLLLLPLLGCGGGWHPNPRSADIPRPVPGGVQQTPFACADANNFGRWAWDCAERCLPAIEARPLLCHGNGEVHLWRKPAEPEPARVYATLEPPDTSGCGVPAYRVWVRLLDNQLRADRAYKDAVTFSTWYSQTAHCQDASVVPREQQAKNFFETHDGDGYLMVADTEIGWAE